MFFMITQLKMNTLEIQSVLKSDSMVAPILYGVFPIDHLPNIVSKPAALVINLDSSKKPGSHWVCIYFNRKGGCDYFDSYGKSPNKKLEKYMLKYATKINTNKKPVQLPFTSTCGQLCIFFLVWRARHVPQAMVMSGLDNSYADEFVTGFVNKLFRINTVTFDENFIVNQISKKYKSK